MPWQPAPIDFPDVELVATAGLRALLASRGVADVFVGNRIPAQRRPRMVIVNRDGGQQQGVIDTPRVRVRVWDETDLAANSLAALVSSLLPLLVNGDPVLDVRRESGPYDVPDESGVPQKYLLFTLRTRGVPA